MEYSCSTSVDGFLASHCQICSPLAEYSGVYLRNLRHAADAGALVVNVQRHLVAELPLDTPACLHEEDSGPAFQNMVCMQKINTKK